MNNENKQVLLEKVYDYSNNSLRKLKYQVGDKIGFCKVKKKFEKRYAPNWTKEIFTVIFSLK